MTAPDGRSGRVSRQTLNDPTAIALLLTDVDGTLVTHDKMLTPRAVAAVACVKAAGMAFALTSGRPPRGMQMLIEPLDIRTPIAGFNGGVIVDRDMAILRTLVLPDDVSAEAVALLQRHQLDVWVYVADDWYVTDPAAPHVAHEGDTVKFQPSVVDRIEDHLIGAAKIVGVSDDRERMRGAEAEAQAAFGARATVARSQPYYLDITHRDANKGGVVAYLAQSLGLDPAQIATIGDQPNDVLMFRPSGYSVAMGNAGDDVKAQAGATTEDSEHEGFAHAVERLIAARAAAR